MVKARIVDWSEHPEDGPGLSQEWKLLTPDEFSKLRRIMVRAEPDPCPAPGCDGVHGHFEWHRGYYRDFQPRSSED
jgi:hypothetical protein